MVLTIVNRQRAIQVNTSALRHLAERALPICLQRAGEGDAPLRQLDAVEISLVNDRVISGLHRRFMNVPGPTDVITFAHGEIVISVATAARQAAHFNQDLHRELSRYIIHGLLHLNGHEDTAQAEAEIMWRVQEEIVNSLCPSTTASARIIFDRKL